MTEKELAKTLAAQLGYGDRKYRRGSNGPNHFFIDGKKTISVSVEFAANIWVIVARAGTRLKRLNPHYQLITQCPKRKDPISHLGNKLVFVKLSDLSDWDQPSIAELVSSGAAKGRDFYARITDVESANLAVDKLLKELADDNKDFPNQIFGLRSLVGLRFLILAIKYETQANDFDDFRQKLIAHKLMDVQCQTWNDLYESGELEERLEEYRDQGDPKSADKPILMNEHPVYAKAAASGFVSSAKLTPERIADLFAISTEKISDAVELRDSLVDYREGIDPDELDCFDFGEGSLVIASNDTISDLDFAGASTGLKLVTFRAFDVSSVYGIELFQDGQSIASRIDADGTKSSFSGDKSLLPPCDEGTMEIFDIFKTIQAEMKVDFWKTPQNQKGIRVKINR